MILKSEAQTLTSLGSRTWLTGTRSLGVSFKMPVQVLKQENNKSIFISYAHQDKKYKDMLEEHLSVAKFYGLRTWTDEQISVGDTWKNEIISALSLIHI